MQNISEKSRYHKRIIIRNTLMAFMGYLIPLIATYAANFFNIAKIPYEQTIYVTIAIVVTTSCFLIIIIFKKKITKAFGIIIGFAELINWLVIFSFWTITLNEVRIMALIAAFFALLYLLSYASLQESLFISISAIISYIAVSYYSIEILHQEGLFKRELFFAIFILPSTIFVSYMAGLFAQQRRNIKKAKRSAEIMRDELWGEMQLAKKIQTVLLPQKPMLKNCDIALYMLPSSEVGGDYYDIINTEKSDWIIIGDVSGHGVSAGLVMMMVQTAIHVVLAQHPDYSPAQLLEAINSPLKKNINLIDKDKYMTITALAHYKDHKFSFAGLHQDILIYRAKNNKVETIETYGKWIGVFFESDIKNDNYTITMNKDDMLLLFTDGLTEAKDSNDKMFGYKKLYALFEHHGNRSPEEVKTAILNELKGYTCNDDVTFIILKCMESN